MNYDIYDTWYQRRLQIVSELPRLYCCEAGKLHVAADIFDSKPSWYMGSKSHVHHPEGFKQHYYVLVKYCPFCGRATPAFKINPQPPPKVRSCADGNYCDTCNDRVDGCMCSAPISAFDAV